MYGHRLVLVTLSGWAITKIEPMKLLLQMRSILILWGYICTCIRMGGGMEMDIHTSFISKHRIISYQEHMKGRA